MKTRLLITTILLFAFGIVNIYAGNTNLKSFKSYEFDDTIKIVVKDTFNIDLVSNPSTGYRWIYMEEEKEKRIVKLSETYTAPEGDRVGEAGVQTFTFLAKKKGTIELYFEYKRSNGEKANNYTVFIEVAKK